MGFEIPPLTFQNIALSTKNVMERLITLFRPCYFVDLSQQLLYFRQAEFTGQGLDA